MGNLSPPHLCLCHNLSKLAVSLNCFNSPDQWSLFTASIIQTLQRFDPVLCDVLIDWWLLAFADLSRGRMCLSDTFCTGRIMPRLWHICRSKWGNVGRPLLEIWIQIRRCSCQEQQEWIFAFCGSSAASQSFKENIASTLSHLWSLNQNRWEYVTIPLSSYSFVYSIIYLPVFVYLKVGSACIDRATITTHVLF